MGYSHQRFYSKKQLGFGIVEIMIAGLLGLFLISGVVQLFLSSNQSYRLQDSLAVLQEDGRMALLYLKDSIQKGSWTDDYLIVPDAIEFSEFRSADGVEENDSDSIAVVFYSVPGDDNNLDCSGVEVLGGKVVNRFYIDNKQLMCQGNGVGSRAQALIGGVEDFQVLYGVEHRIQNSKCQAGVINNYLNANKVMELGLTSRVMSVRVGLLLASESEILPVSESKNYQLLDKPITKTDRLARRVFQQTIFMPNSAYATAGNPQTIIECM